MPSWSEKQSPLRSLSIFLIAAAMTAAGCRSEEPEPGTGIVATSGIRECPHTWDWSKQFGKERGVVVESHVVSLTRGAHHVPEYNDCQKFLVRSSGARVYSQGQFAIFAVQDPELAIKLDSLANARLGLAAAVVYAEEAYAYLGIEKGFNCLVLYSAGTGWRAAMRRPTDEVADCSGTFPFGGGQALAVRPPLSPLPAGQEHYAQLARWGFDERSEQHYIAITCGEAICNIGREGFTERDTPVPPTSSPTTAERRVHEVATWHDEQLLASFPTGASTVQPTDVWGTVIPDTGLGYRNTLDDFKNRWVPVAEVELSEDHPEYRQKGFQMTTPGNRNIVQSCVIDETTGSTCPDLPDEFRPGGKCDATDDASTGQRWRSRHIAVDGTIKYFCVKRYPLGVTGLAVPAAARWRWRADDEMLWYRCMEGCCDELS